ncbi:MAG: polyphosphate polymerase domain-containing protein [Lachnospiraceae bacterium]|nr:polyphosphate polymerase domain-containing protein [Lachnospiraceae bacterium]
MEKEKRYRHEWKHAISYADLLTIRARMSAVAIPDPHTLDGKYLIRSLYFDNVKDKALREKVDGVNMREKFRIRYYNFDTSLIHLEKKSKNNGLGTKYSANLSAEEAQKIVDGDIDWMLESGRPLIEELYCKMRYQGMKPMTIVDYTREPFIFAPGNVRVTLDYDIRTGLGSTDFLNPDCITIPAGDAPIILEVKWDAYLPDIIRDAVQLPGCRVGAFSKYAQCRVYG